MRSIVKILILNTLFITGLKAQQEEFGLASYYSDMFQGKPTASGEMYDKAKLTGAHKSIPFGASVKVTRLDNNKSVVVRINDRGPYITGRVIEISRAAASQIGLLEDGSTRVKVELVKEETADAAVADKQEDAPKAEENTPPKANTAGAATATSPQTENADKPKDEKPAPAKKPVEDTKKNDAPETKAPAKPETPKATNVTASNYQQFDLFQIELKKPERKGYGVQVASLSTQDALFKKIAQLQGEWFSTILVGVQQGKSQDEISYKVILGTFETKKEADIYKINLKRNKKIDGFVVDLSSVNQ